MKIIALGLVTLLFAQSCNNKELNKRAYKQGTYIRVSSREDSALKLYIVYKSAFDANRTMLKTYWDNGKVQSIGFFLNGKKDGNWNQFHDNGLKSFEGSFRQDLKEGVHKIYSPDGKLYSVEEYYNDNKIGEEYYYKPEESLLKKK